MCSLFFSQDEYSSLNNKTSSLLIIKIRVKYDLPWINIIVLEICHNIIEVQLLGKVNPAHIQSELLVPQLEVWPLGVLDGEYLDGLRNPVLPEQVLYLVLGRDLHELVHFRQCGILHLVVVIGHQVYVSAVEVRDDRLILELILFPLFFQLIPCLRIEYSHRCLIHDYHIQLLDHNIHNKPIRIKLEDKCGLQPLFLIKKVSLIVLREDQTFIGFRQTNNGVRYKI